MSSAEDSSSNYDWIPESWGRHSPDVVIEASAPLELLSSSSALSQLFDPMPPLDIEGFFRNQEGSNSMNWEDIPMECLHINNGSILREIDDELCGDIYDYLVGVSPATYRREEHPTLGTLVVWNEYYFMVMPDLSGLRAFQFNGDRLTYDQIVFSPDTDC